MSEKIKELVKDVESKGDVKVSRVKEIHLLEFYNEKGEEIVSFKQINYKDGF